MKVPSILIVIAALCAAGCETSDPGAAVGQSTSELIKAQTADPATLTSPSAAPVNGGDPDMLNYALQPLRQHQSDPAQVIGDTRYQVQVRAGTTGTEK